MAFLQQPMAHFQQRHDGDCLAACAAMALNYLGVRRPYRRILRTLGTIVELGTPFSNISHLQAFGVFVTVDEGTFESLHHRLMQNQPCIVSVNTGELPYWEQATAHAIVVIGLDDVNIYAHDPDLPHGPIAIPLGDFDLAWLEGDELYAVLIKA